MRKILFFLSFMLLLNRFIFSQSSNKEEKINFFKNLFDYYNVNAKYDGKNFIFDGSSDISGMGKLIEEDFLSFYPLMLQHFKNLTLKNFKMNSESGIYFMMSVTKLYFFFTFISSGQNLNDLDFEGISFKDSYKLTGNGLLIVDKKFGKKQWLEFLRLGKNSDMYMIGPAEEDIVRQMAYLIKLLDEDLKNK